MSKTREALTKGARESVLREFNYRCALCGADRPQIHHIDENPAHNTADNLIALCPNCHLSDQHNPTQPLDPGKLALFRKFKDPFILKPQFDPLFIRLRFLNEIEVATDINSLAWSACELVDFISEMQMGSFYKKRIEIMTMRPPEPAVVSFLESGAAALKNFRENELNIYKDTLRKFKDNICALVVESLRYQGW